jgi:hypothetical protein
MGGVGERRTIDSTAWDIMHQDYGVRRGEGGKEPRDGAAHTQRQGTRWQKIGLAYPYFRKAFSHTGICNKKFVFFR